MFTEYVWEDTGLYRVDEKRRITVLKIDKRSRVYK